MSTVSYKESCAAQVHKLLPTRHTAVHKRWWEKISSNVNTVFTQINFTLLYFIHKGLHTCDVTRISSSGRVYFIMPTGDERGTGSHRSEKKLDRLEYF